MNKRLDNQIDLSKFTFLVVEDDEFYYLYLKLILSKVCKRLVRAEKGEEALSLADNEHFDVILVDYNLPEMNGVEVTRQIRKLQPEAVIIMQSALNNPDKHQQAIDAGCNECMMKPIKLERIVKVIEKVLNP